MMDEMDAGGCGLVAQHETGMGSISSEVNRSAIELHRKQNLRQEGNCDDRAPDLRPRSLNHNDSISRDYGRVDKRLSTIRVLYSFWYPWCSASVGYASPAAYGYDLIA